MNSSTAEEGTSRSLRGRERGELLAAIGARLLAPGMMLWRAAREQSITHVARPEDSPQSTVAGPDKLSVLVFGSGPAFGWGVRSHDLALPGSLARALAARTGRGVQVDLRSERTMTVATAGRLLGDLALARYDAIIIVFSIKDALELTPVRRWRRQLGALIDQLERESAPGTPVIIGGIQAVRSIPAYDSGLGEIANSHAQRLNRATEALVRERGRFFFEPLVIPAGRRSARHRESGDYVYWAKALATVLSTETAPRLQQSGTGPVSHPPSTPSALATVDEIDEELRQQAVDLLRLPERVGDERIQHLVDVARRALQADAAIFGVLDHDRHLHLAESGSRLEEVARGASFCDYTIQRQGGLTVLDASRDSRFASNPWVVGAPRVRFYSGFPVEAPNGQRVGALCVFDAQPRTADQVNEELIEELALLIQRELWRYLPED